MKSSKTSTWVGGAVAIALVLFVGAYFLLISPMLATASDSRAQATATRQSNELLQTKVTRLAAQFKHLDEYKANLAALRTQVPTQAQLSDYLRRIDTLAAANGVTVTAITPGDPTAFAPKAVAAPTSGDPSVDQATKQQTGSTDGASPAPTAAPTAPAAPPAAAGAPAGMVDVQLSISAVGGYDQIVAFLSALQTTDGRLLLVTGFTGAGAQNAASSNGLPATHVGDLNVTLTGLLYVLPDTAPAPAPTASATPAPLPAAVPGKNPVVPAA